MEYNPPAADLKYKRVDVSTGDFASDGDILFKFPDEGAYLLEAENNVATRLPHELIDSDAPLVRILKDFSIFNSCSHNLVSLSHFWNIDTPCEAFGMAVADIDDDHESPNLFDASIPFRTSTILSYSLDIHQE